MGLSKYFLLALTLIILFSPIVTAEESCHGNLSLLYSLKSVEESDIEQISEYQHPNFKEDDLLVLGYIKVKNVGECDINNSTLRIRLTDSDGEPRIFCDLNLPNIKKNEIYELKYQDLKEKNQYFSRGWAYKCLRRLDKVGSWKIELPAITSTNTGSLSLLSDSSLFYNGEIVSRNFKVFSKNELLTIKLTERSIRMGALFSLAGAVIGALLGFLSSFFLEWWKSKKRKTDALVALIHELNENLNFAQYLKENSEKYLTEGKTPFRDFITLNVERVLSGDVVGNLSILQKLFDYYALTRTIENFVVRTRQIGVPRRTTDMGRVLDIINNDYLELSKSIIEDLNNPLSSHNENNPLQNDRNVVNKDEIRDEINALRYWQEPLYEIIRIIPVVLVSILTTIFVIIFTLSRDLRDFTDVLQLFLMMISLLGITLLFQVLLLFFTKKYKKYDRLIKEKYNLLIGKNIR